MVLVGIAGCGGGEPRVEVAGRITLDEKPLANAQVIFYSITKEDQRSFVGQVDEQGNYQLEQSGSDEAGVPPGKYSVSISTAVPEGEVDEFTVYPPERVPDKYRNGALEYEVPAAGTTEANFDLES